MGNMSNHEIYICGWITGRLENAGLHCSIAYPDIFPFSTMGYMLSKAHGARKISRELDKEIGAALEDFDAEHGPEDTEKPLPMERRMYWIIGRQAGTSGKPYNPNYAKPNNASTNRPLICHKTQKRTSRFV